MLGSREPQLLLGGAVRGCRLLGLFFSNSWKSRVAVGWFACRRRETAACRKPGIGRLTSDIGLRPNARCPAQERECDGGGCGCWWAPGGNGGTGRRNEQPASVAPRTLPRTRAADAGVGAGEFPFLKKAFGKLSLFIGCYGYRASNVKAKSIYTLALFPKLWSTLSLRFVETLHREEGHALLELKEQCGLLEGRVVPYVCLKSQVWTPWLRCTRIEGNQALACFDDFHLRPEGVLSGARCKLEGKPRVVYMETSKGKQRSKWFLCSGFWVRECLRV